MKAFATAPFAAFALLAGIASQTARAEPLIIPIEQTIPIAGYNNQGYGSVALRDGVLVVGAPRFIGNPPRVPGSVYVFTRSADPECSTQRCWVLDREFQSPSPSPGDFFGHTIVLDDQTLAIAAPAVEDADDAAVYVYERHGKRFGPPQRLTGDPIEATPPADRNFFGKGLALQDDRLVVTSLANGEPELTPGAVYVFERCPNGQWRREAKLQDAHMPFNGGGFGMSVSLDRDTIVVGANANGANNAIVFRRTGNQWHEAQILIPWDNNYEDPRGFGTSVSLKGRRLVVGDTEAPDALGNSTGGAYVFQRQNGTWIPAQTLQRPLEEAGQVNANYGGATLIHGNKIAVAGAFGILIFERQGESYQVVAKLLPPSGTSFDIGHGSRPLVWSGHTLAVAGSVAVYVFNMKVLGCDTDCESAAAQN